MSQVIKVSSKYNKIYNIYSEVGFTESNIILDYILNFDQNYTFFTNIMRETSDELQMEVMSASQFYLDRFGIDLSKFNKLPDGSWTLGEHSFYPYIKDRNEQAIEVSNSCCGVTNYKCVEGGFVLSIGAPGVVSKGTYGKETGENISAGSLIFYGYYVFIDEKNQGKIYHLRSNSPSKSNIEIPLSWNFDVYDYSTSSWGKSIGLSILDSNKMNLNKTTNTNVNVVSNVPVVNTVQVPKGYKYTESSVSLRNNEPLPLIVNNVPISNMMKTEMLVSNVQVPSYAPIIKQEIVRQQENINIKSTLVSRCIITF